MLKGHSKSPDCTASVHKYFILGELIYWHLAVSGVKSLLRIRTLDDVTLLSEASLLPRLRELKLQSEGYESMTQHSSDIMSEVRYVLHSTFNINLCAEAFNQLTL